MSGAKITIFLALGDSKQIQNKNEFLKKMADKVLIRKYEPKYHQEVCRIFANGNFRFI